MKQNKSKGSTEIQAEGGKTTFGKGELERGRARGGKGLRERRREMDEPNYPPIFLRGAEPQSKQRAEREKENNRNVSNDGGR